ncbi:hypothetical protein QVD17_38339 [Tagetes erecta]|uniref:Uncharacterized protein n=1 Tax=Tagetes erecta TaxID=13708 RepID=A0AAD8JN89_TARER|nr:hypothetical protein QVD17_38339 [Tagetes erecta]
MTKPASTQNLVVDQNLVVNQNVIVDTLLSTMINKQDVASTAHSFLVANSQQVEACQKMLEIWESLEPPTQKVLALASMVKLLQKEKDLLINNLIKAENEVELFFEENNKLYKMIDNLMELIEKERQLNDSGGKNNSASLKNNKQKTSPKDCGSTESKPVNKEVIHLAITPIRAFLTMKFFSHSLSKSLKGVDDI